jgi:hypothetical protein
MGFFVATAIAWYLTELLRSVVPLPLAIMASSLIWMGAFFATKRYLEKMKEDL